VNNEIDSAMGFPFADSNGLFYIETVPLSESEYAMHCATMSGCKLWHRGMGRCCHQSIKATVSYITGLEELENKKVELNLDCASCMVGKATLQPYPQCGPQRKDSAVQPLE
jgi:hypothetical protein